MKGNNGWVKFHRQILDWGWYGDANTFRLFFHLVMTANHEDKVWMGVNVPRGSLISSYPHLAEKLKLTVQNIRTSIFKLKSTGEITVKTTNKFSVVSVNNYDEYQEINRQTNKPLTVNQQATNTKQEYKNVRNKEIYVEIVSHFNQVMGKRVSAINESGVDYWLNKGKTVEDIKKAIDNLPYENFWKDKMDLMTLFRKRNPQGEEVDYIDKLINTRGKITEEEKLTEIAKNIGFDISKYQLNKEDVKK